MATAEVTGYSVWRLEQDDDGEDGKSFVVRSVMIPREHCDVMLIGNYN